MKVLVVHPEDCLLRGPWSRQRWDLVIDLGKSSEFSMRRWNNYSHCPVLRLESFRGGISDVKQVRQIFSAGRGILMDQYGVDWWKLACTNFIREAETALAIRRLCSEVDASADFWATWPGWPCTALSSVIGRPIAGFASSPLRRFSVRFAHYSAIVRRLSLPLLHDIVVDQLDPDFRLRSRFAKQHLPLRSPVVLVPSAYENVSRMALGYARLLPNQPFLMVTTRPNAALFDHAPNMAVRCLESYAGRETPAEASSILESWSVLESRLLDEPEFRILHDCGVLARFPALLHASLLVRDAWNRVLDTEPVCSVLCGDDNNIYNSIPTLLAAHRGLPTLNFHHGALDWCYMVKDLDCRLYLAKSEMERDYLTGVCELPAEKIVLAAPGRFVTFGQTVRQHADAIVLFSEPYEATGARVREVYAELLPHLAAVARQRGSRVIVKLHPFESLKDRSIAVRSVIRAEDKPLVSVVDGPLSAALLAQTWFGITVQSTTALDCVLNNVPCFLCEWLANPSNGYVQQYARFGLGVVLKDAEDIVGIPTRLEGLNLSKGQPSFWSPVDSERLAEWLTCSEARSS